MDDAVVDVAVGDVAVVVAVRLKIMVAVVAAVSMVNIKTIRLNISLKIMKILKIWLGLGHVGQIYGHFGQIWLVVIADIALHLILQLIFMAFSNRGYLVCYDRL